MILKIPVVLGDEIITGTFNRDSISVAIPRDGGAECDIYVHHILVPFRTPVPHARFAQFLARAHAETHASMSIDAKDETPAPAQPRGTD